MFWFHAVCIGLYIEREQFSHPYYATVKLKWIIWSYTVYLWLEENFHTTRHLYGTGAPEAKRLKSLVYYHSAPHRMISCAGWVKSFHVILPIHANISIFVHVGSSSSSYSCKTPYDHEGVSAIVTENQIHKYREENVVCWNRLDLYLKTLCTADHYNSQGVVEITAEYERHCTPVLIQILEFFTSCQIPQHIS